MSFVYEKRESFSEADCATLRKLVDRCRALRAPEMREVREGCYEGRNFWSWVVDRERGMYLLWLSVGGDREGFLQPSILLLVVGDELVMIYALEHGLFCDFENKVRGIEYRALLPLMPERLVDRRDEVVAWVREAMQAYGYSQSTEWTTMTEVRVTFVEGREQLRRPAAGEQQ